MLGWVPDTGEDEIARLEGMCSDHGVRLEAVGGRAARNALFAALGHGVEGRTGEALRVSLGWGPPRGAPSTT